MPAAVSMRWSLLACSSRSPTAPLARSTRPAPVTLPFTSNLTQDAVRGGRPHRQVEYIRAGDIFQFVPSQRLRVQSKADPFDVYRALRIINPSPFMFYLKSPAAR